MKYRCPDCGWVTCRCAVKVIPTERKPSRCLTCAAPCDDEFCSKECKGLIPRRKGNKNRGYTKIREDRYVDNWSKMQSRK